MSGRIVNLCAYTERRKAEKYVQVVVEFVGTVKFAIGVERSLSIGLYAFKANLSEHAFSFAGLVWLLQSVCHRGRFSCWRKKVYSIERLLIQG